MMLTYSAQMPASSNSCSTAQSVFPVESTSSTPLLTRPWGPHPALSRFASLSNCGCQRRDMRYGLDNRNGGWGELASFANQHQGHINPRGQRRRIDKAAGLATRHRINFGPVTREVGLQ